MDLMTDVNKWYFITFKFDGNWTEVKGQSRMKYKGGSQKTVKLERDKINFYVLKEQIDLFCPWLRGQDFGLEEARGKPVVELVDMIRGMLMEVRAQRKINSTGWKGHLVPHVEEYIREITTRKEQFIIRHSTTTKAEVEGTNERREVDIEKKECSCNFWQISGLPCIHAVAVIGTIQHPLWHTYVDDHYHVHSYRVAYEGAISTLPGKDQWNVVIDEVEVGVPNCLRPRGRPKKRRIKSYLEGMKNKSKSFHRCSRCGLWGHHKSTCKNPINTQTICPDQVTDCSNIAPDVVAVRAKLPFRREDI